VKSQTSLTKVNFTFAKGKNFTNKTGRFEQNQIVLAFLFGMWYNENENIIFKEAYV
jgi:hypothetical protein